MIQPKMIVLDLDSTLLHDDKSCSDYSCQIISRFSQQGKVVVASGRAKDRCEDYIKKIGAQGLVAMNGAMVYADSVCIQQSQIQKEKILSLIRMLTELTDTQVNVIYPTVSYTTNLLYLSDTCFKLDIQTLSSQEIQKISIYTPHRDKLLAIDFHSYHCRLIQNANDPTYFVLVGEDINKLKGITTLCDYWGIALNEVAAFGDDYNDIEMITGCGLGLVVSNGQQAVLDIADEVIASNQEDGPAKKIEQWLYK